MIVTSSDTWDDIGAFAVVSFESRQQGKSGERFRSNRLAPDLLIAATVPPESDRIVQQVKMDFGPYNSD